MPLYEFRCERCGGYTDRIQRHDDKAPTCCGQPMTRIVTAPAGFIFKGEGFHVNDYGKGSA